MWLIEDSGCPEDRFRQGKTDWKGQERFVAIPWTTDDIDRMIAKKLLRVGIYCVWEKYTLCIPRCVSPLQEEDESSSRTVYFFFLPRRHHCCDRTRSRTSGGLTRADYKTTYLFRLFCTTTFALYQQSREKAFLLPTQCKRKKERITPRENSLSSNQDQGLGRNERVGYK